jgi:hypothetical protein
MGAGLGASSAHRVQNWLSSQRGDLTSGNFVMEESY